MCFALQLKPLPKTVAVRSMFEARDWSYELQHGSVWGSQEISLSGVYSAPPTLKMGNKTLKGKSVTPVPFPTYQGGSWLISSARPCLQCRSAASPAAPVWT